jgi:hypothetical protein
MPYLGTYIVSNDCELTWLDIHLEQLFNPAQDTLLLLRIFWYNVEDPYGKQLFP